MGSLAGSHFFAHLLAGALLVVNWPHGILGVLQHYRHLPDLTSIVGDVGLSVKSGLAL
jgi:hypothetical protein